jgi:hypothetical protein
MPPVTASASVDGAISNSTANADAIGPVLRVDAEVGRHGAPLDAFVGQAVLPDIFPQRCSRTFARANARE